MEAKETEYDGQALITYSNRIQKHMLSLTEEIVLDNQISLQEKRRLKYLILNLPPKAKEEFKDILAKLESKDEILNTTQYDLMYSKVSDWIYQHILLDAFKARPQYGGMGKL